MATKQHRPLHYQMYPIFVFTSVTGFQILLRFVLGPAVIELQAIWEKCTVDI